MRLAEKTKRAQRARRKLRALQQSKRRARSVGPVSALPPSLGAVVNALASALNGYTVCARRTSDAKVIVAVKSAASTLQTLLDTLVAGAADHGIQTEPRGRLADLLRWEWIASTGAVMDGTPDPRLLAETARILASTIGLDVSPLGVDLATRVRLASAESYSLAAAVQPHRVAAALPAVL